MLKEDAEKREMLNIRKSKERKESAKGGKKSSMLLRRLRGKGTKQIKQGRIADRNIIFVAGLGSIGMGASREILKKGPKVKNRQQSLMKRKANRFVHLESADFW